MGGGLAGLGLMGLALAGVAVAPPVVAAVAIADALFSVADAAKEFMEWRTRSHAFDACLDPSLSLGAEPSTFSTLFIVAFDLLSVASPAKVPRP